MIQLVIFLEEPSAKAMLDGLLPKILPDNVYHQCVPFEGKQDLEKRLPIRLRAWQKPNTKFIVMRDQDNGNCLLIKQNLMQKCANAGKPETLVRIACRELESFYLGDLKAVSKALGIGKLDRQQEKSKYRDPDRIQNPSAELKRLVPQYQKIAGSRAIGPLLDLENNKSKSFNMLLGGIYRLTGGAP